MTRDAIIRATKLDPATQSSWAKVKFDRQIVAIAKVVGATSIYSTDTDVAKHAREAGIPSVSLEDLPNPPMPPQIELDLVPTEPPIEIETDQDD